jgi:hypothetical protein
MAKKDTTFVQFSNLEADFMSDLVVNCETPSDILGFTQFIEQTITSNIGAYHKEADKIQKTFQERIEVLAPEYLEKDENGNWKHSTTVNPDGTPSNKPVAKEGKQEDWDNLFQGAQQEMSTSLQKLGNTVVGYNVDNVVFNRFVDIFMRNPVKTFVSLQQDPKEVNRAYLMIYLIAKRIEDAKVQAKGTSK